jgi:hypothetical protein
MRKPSFSIVFAVSVVLLPMSLAIAQESARFSHVPEERAKVLGKSFDHKKLPAGAQIHVDSTQVFSLVASNAPELTILPVDFSVKRQKDEPQYQCGVLFLSPNGTSNFVLTSEQEDIQDSQICENISAIGKMPDPGARPRLLLLFNFSAMNGNPYKKPYLLVWDETSNNYKVDRTTSHWLVEQTDSETIAGLKRLLAKPGPKIPQGKY